MNREQLASHQPLRIFDELIFENEINDFYNNILGLESLSPDNFLRTQSSDKKGYSGKIKFVSDGNIQMHLAEKDLNVAAENKQFLMKNDFETFKNIKSHFLMTAHIHYKDIDKKCATYSKYIYANH